jgi:hypothetical protein
MSSGPGAKMGHPQWIWIRDRLPEILCQECYPTPGYGYRFASGENGEIMGFYAAGYCNKCKGAGIPAEVL